jgi:hypothetical protein
MSFPPRITDSPAAGKDPASPASPMPHDQPALGRDSYSVTVTVGGTQSQQYARLKIRRLRDKKTIYPFDGAPEIGPYEDMETARNQALAYGWSLVDADIALPE